MILFFQRFIYLLGTAIQKERKRYKQKNLPSASSVPKWPQQLGLDRTEGRSLGLYLGILGGFRSPSTQVIYHQFLKPLTGSWTRSRSASTQASVHMGCLSLKLQLKFYHNASTSNLIFKAPKKVQKVKIIKNYHLSQKNGHAHFEMIII